jgi:DNA polymerase (family 10)
LGVAAGCLLTIDSDAHRTEELEGIGWGVAQARRAWVEPSVVANTWSRDELLAWVAGKPARIAAAAERGAPAHERAESAARPATAVPQSAA